MGTARGSSRPREGGLPQCMLEYPPGVGLETPPRCGPGDPPGLGVGLETPLARPLTLNFPLSVGLETPPGHWQGMLGYHHPWRPAARHAGIPPAMHAGIPPPMWTEWQTCVKTSPSQTSFAGWITSKFKTERAEPMQWRIQDFPNGGHCFVANGGAHILFSGKKCMKLKEIGLKWGGARLLAPCYSKITIFLWIILNSIMKTSYFTYLRIFWDILYKIIF